VPRPRSVPAPSGQDLPAAEALRRLLGEEDDGLKELEELRERIRGGDLPEPVLELAMDEWRRLARLSPSAHEYPAVREHLRFLSGLPWGRSAAAPVDLDRARAILDRDLYGLADVKERILEFLAVMATSARGTGPILCLVGPSGVGKTRLATSLAEAAGRPFVQVTVAGVDDESEIKGWPRTHAGAVPGKILRAVRRAGSRDAVFMVDELDRIAGDLGTAPASALLEALDPAVNHAFVDHYLDVPFDLSPVFFVTTANVAYEVPRALRDRLEVLSMPGYTWEEKVEIARRHLLPAALDRAGIPATEVAVTDDALRDIVRRYTREAGVWGLQRMLARVGRRLALHRATGKSGPTTVDADGLRAVLGAPRYEESTVAREPAVGVVAGLAWTAEGGVLQLIEATSMAGAGRIVVTGRLGDVMRESADIAYSWARANARSIGFEERNVQDLDLHVHAPEGGVRKDGPSAGVAIATAIVSVFTQRPVRPDVAMTGELTLRGRVLEVDGVREKASAALRAGVRHLLLPSANRKDVDGLPEHLRRGIRFEFLERVTEFLDLALLPSTRAP
jgi:ATP-dependent Lon protease